METVTPLDCAHRFAILVTAGTRSLSAQITIVVSFDAFDALVAGDTTTTTASATTASARAARSVRMLNICSSSFGSRRQAPLGNVLQHCETSAGKLLPVTLPVKRKNPDRSA